MEAQAGWTLEVDANEQSDDQRGSPSRANTLDRIVRQLEEEIVLGHLRPRERMLEEDLSKRFDAKRHLIRAALAELETMGIVVRQPNRGAAVRDFTANEVGQIYSVREVLESHAAKIMPLPPVGAVIAALKRIHQRHSEAIESQDLRTVFRANLEFHRVFFAACGNPYLAGQIDQLASQAHAIRFHAITDVTLARRARDEHGRMIDLLESGDRDPLVDLVAAHIRPSKEAYLRLSNSQWGAVLPL